MLHASEPCQQGPISVAWVMKDLLAGSHLWSGWDVCEGINGNHANGSTRSIYVNIFQLFYTVMCWYIDVYVGQC